MTERLRTTLMITAIVLASAFVTATTWAGLRVVTAGSPSMQQRQATITQPASPFPAKLMPFYRGARSAPVAGRVHVMPAHPKPHAP
jgi:hypothetical protein